MFRIKTEVSSVYHLCFTIKHNDSIAYCKAIGNGITDRNRVTVLKYLFSNKVSVKSHRITGTKLIGEVADISASVIEYYACLLLPDMDNKDIIPAGTLFHEVDIVSFRTEFSVIFSVCYAAYSGLQMIQRGNEFKIQTVVISQRRSRYSSVFSICSHCILAEAILNTQVTAGLICKINARFIF